MVARDEQVFGVSDFSGGLNTSVVANRIEDNELWDAVDIEIDSSGVIIPRPNTATCVTDTDDLVSLIGFYHNATTGLSYLIYYRENGADTELTALSSAGITTVIATFVGALTTARKNAMITEYNNKAYITPGPSGDIYELTDLVGAAVGAAPNLYVSTIFKDRLFGAIVLSQRLYFSDTGDFSVWPGTNFIDIEGVDPTPITAFEILNDVLYIFKQNSIWALYVQGDPANWTLRLINPTLGAKNKRAVTNIDGSIFFMSNKGLFETDGLDFDNVGRKVFDRQIFMKSSPISLEGVELIRYNDRLIVNFPEIVSIYVYNIRSKAWYIWRTASTTKKHFTSNIIGRGDFKAVPYFLYQDDSLQCFMDSEVYMGGSSFTTKVFDFEAPTFMKRAKFWAIECAGDLNIDSITIYQETGSEVINSFTEIVADQDSPYLIKFAEGLYFRRVQFQINFTQNSGTLPDELGNILGIFCHYALESRVRQTG